MRCHHHAGRPADALAAWEAAPERFKTPQAQAVASLASLDADRIDDARRFAEASLGAGGPPAIEALVSRATVAVGEDDIALAHRLLDHALKALPTDGRVWSAIAVARLGEGNVAGADQAFVQATTFMPQHIGSWHGLAWCQLVQGNVEAARASFETALALDRNFGETHGGLAVVAALQGRKEDARESIERAERLDRTGLSARYAQALLDGNAQDAQALKALATRMLKGRPGIDAMRLLERLTGGTPRR
jgi:Flp pilus assembly protein TadD